MFACFIYCIFIPHFAAVFLIIFISFHFDLVYLCFFPANPYFRLESKFLMTISCFFIKYLFVQLANLLFFPFDELNTRTEESRKLIVFFFLLKFNIILKKTIEYFIILYLDLHTPHSILFQGKVED